MEIIDGLGLWLLNNIVGFVIFLFVIGVIAWLIRQRYKKTINVTKDEFQKEKVRLEVLLATFGALVVAGVFAFLQFYQTAYIADQQDYHTAVDFLSSGSPAVRENGVDLLYKRAKQAKKHSNNDDVKKIWDLLNDHVKYFTRDDSYKKSFPTEPASDIAFILKIQSSSEKINEESYPFEGMRIIDWKSAWLRGADLRNAQLQGASLFNTQLQGAFLFKAQLQGADLYKANLEATNLESAQRQGPHLAYVQLQEANLESAQLQGANLESAQLQGTNLSKANLQGAYLESAQLQGAYLTGAQLQGANLGRAELQEATLHNANFQGVFGFQKRLEMLLEPLLYGNKTHFEYTIRNRARQNTEVDLIVFEGGMKDKLSTIEKNMTLKATFWEMNDHMATKKENLQNLLDTLKKKHSGDPNSREYMTIEDLNKQGAVYGTYTEVDATIWIYEHKKAVGSEELDPEVPFAYYMRGTAYANKGDRDLAIKDYTKVIELNPNFADAYNDRGFIYRQQGRDYLAIQDYKTAIRLDPNKVAYNNLGDAYASVGKYHSAIRNYSEAINLAPENVAAYYKRGLSRLILKKLDDAKEDLMTANKKTDIIAEKFQQEYGSLKKFEQKYGFTVPDDIRELLGSSDSGP